MPDIDKPSLLAAASRLRRAIADPYGDWTPIYGKCPTDWPRCGGGEWYPSCVEADHKILASALLALMPAEEEPQAHRGDPAFHEGWIILSGEVVETPIYGPPCTEKVSMYWTEADALLALQWQSFWRHWEVMGLGKGES